MGCLQGRAPQGRESTNQLCHEPVIPSWSWTKLKPDFEKTGSELEAEALEAKATFEQSQKTMDDSRVSDENLLGEERKKAQGEKLKAIHATNQENAKRRRTVSVAPPALETHTAGGTPVLVLETIFEAAADDEAAGGTGAASSHAFDGDHQVKGKGNKGKGKGKDSLELGGQGGVEPAADEKVDEEGAKSD